MPFYARRESMDLVLFVACCVAGIGVPWLVFAAVRMERIGPEWRVVPVPEWWRRWRKHGRDWWKHPDPVIAPEWSKRS